MYISLKITCLLSLPFIATSILTQSVLFAGLITCLRNTCISSSHRSLLTANVHRCIFRQCSGRWERCWRQVYFRILRIPRIRHIADSRTVRINVTLRRISWLFSSMGLSIAIAVNLVKLLNHSRNA